MKNLTIRARKRDVERFTQKARNGEIPPNAIEPLALVYAAMCKAQQALGPGHAPMDAVFEAVPEAYARNWLKQAARRAA